MVSDQAANVGVQPSLLRHYMLPSLSPIMDVLSIVTSSICAATSVHNLTGHMCILEGPAAPVPLQA